MRLTHLHTNVQGESAFTEIELPLERNGAEQITNFPTPIAMVLNQTDVGHHYPWHNAPKRQWVITLQGEIEIKLRDGQSRKFGAGSILLADDLSGSGHTTSVISLDPWECIYLPFDGKLF